MFIPSMSDFDLSELKSDIDIGRTVSRLMDQTDQIAARGMEEPSEIVHERSYNNTILIQTVPLEYVITEVRSCKCRKIILPKTNHSVRCGLCGSAVEYPYTKRTLVSKTGTVITDSIKAIIKKHREEEEAAKEAAEKAEMEARERRYAAARQARERREAERQKWQVKIITRLKDAETVAHEKLPFTEKELQDNMAGIKMVSLLYEAVSDINNELQKDKDRVEEEELRTVLRLKRVFMRPIQPCENDKEE